MVTARACNVLMIYPRFTGGTAWNYAGACKVLGAKCPTGPLGLITMAAMLPQSWSVRLVDRNAEELTEGDIAWADLVMTGGMIAQQFDTLQVIDLCHAHKKPVAIGGPAVTSSPEVYETADFRVLGEAEGIIDKFIAAWEAGERRGTFQAEKFTADVTKTPIPRFDLLKFSYYLQIGVQFSRGCPFLCEFCDIIELYGRVPRAKTNAQMLAELEALYQLGYRGHVDFVDDNLIGNKKAVKAFLPELKKWLEERDYPFEFTTEASLNLADDPELMRLMNDANFFGVFVGIESPDPETLIMTQKKQNTRRDIAESIHKIYASGLWITAGFIVGFDSEKASVANAMIALIEDAAIPVCMLGLLYALPNTQLQRRLAREGRLHPPPKIDDTYGDQCTSGLNFDTLRPRQEILFDYQRVLDKVYEPAAFAARLRRLSDRLDNSTRKRQPRPTDKLKGLEIVHRVISGLPEAREIFRETIAYVRETNPHSLRWIVLLMALYLHLGPFSRYVMGVVERKIQELDAAPPVGPAVEQPRMAASA
jgi:radical SAM superfamily enzyme YgiQ (UPF0313 family)